MLVKALRHPTFVETVEKMLNSIKIRESAALTAVTEYFTRKGKENPFNMMLAEC
jgi:hypothetical protein